MTCAGAVGAILTFLLHKHGSSAVVASCIVGLIGAFAGYMFSIPHLSLVVFTGTFVGMTSVALGSVPMVIIGGGLAGFLYVISLPLYDGFGGRLGAIAFLSMLAVFYLFVLIDKWFGATAAEQS